MTTNSDRLREKFWANVTRSDGCWEWQGRRQHNGYGIIAHKSKNVLTHRLSFELTHGGIPAGKIICHKCNNPPCVRPDHLYAGTYADNLYDNWRNNPGERERFIAMRHAERGSDHANALLTDEQVLEIWRSKGTITNRAAAKLFGVAQSTVADIRRGHSWRHLTNA